MVGHRGDIEDRNRSRDRDAEQEVYHFILDFRVATVSSHSYLSLDLFATELASWIGRCLRMDL